MKFQDYHKYFPNLSNTGKTANIMNPITTRANKIKLIGSNKCISIFCNVNAHPCGQ